ncbi:hypothetical protein OC844_005621 [Tilletia horrida]|nr:hypothetical protein OC844_005621 [Tilletia horrida]
MYYSTSNIPPPLRSPTTPSTITTYSASINGTGYAASSIATHDDHSVFDSGNGKETLASTDDILKAAKKNAAIHNYNSSTSTLARAPPPPHPAKTLTPESIELEGTEDPRQWSAAWKWATVATISWAGFLSPLASSIIAPATGVIAHDLHLTNRLVEVLPISMYVLGLGLGPFLLSPVSETIGRRWVYIVSGLIFFLFNVGTALAPNMAALAVLRLLAGFAGSTGPCLGAASIGDMFAPAQRGKAVAIYALGPILGPSVGNILGSFIAERTRSWTWPLWIVTIASVTLPITSYCFLTETYAPVLKERKYERLLREAEQQHQRAVPSPEHKDNGLVTSPPPPPPKFQKLSKALAIACTRPFKLMFTNPICTIVALFQAYIYGILYLCFATLTILFASEAAEPGLHNYGWSLGLSGLVYIPLGLGSISAACINVAFANRVYAFLVKRDLDQEPRRVKGVEGQVGAAPGRSAGNGSGSGSGMQDVPLTPLPNKAAGGPPSGPGPTSAPAPARGGRPEFRLPFVCLAALILAIGLFWFGWSAQAGTRWPLPFLGIFLLGIGATLAFQCLMVYLVDCSGRFAASAIAVSVLLRSVLGATFPLFGKNLYTSCGYGWGNSVLGFAALAILPFSVFMLLRGEAMRKRFEFKG